jgi:hypothetical protein
MSRIAVCSTLAISTVVVLAASVYHTQQQDASTPSKGGVVKIDLDPEYSGPVPPPWNKPATRGKSSKPLEIGGPNKVEWSNPIVAGGASFTAIAETEWTLQKRGDPHVPVRIQLLVANLTDAELVFPTFDTWHLRVKDPKGFDTNAGGGRDHTTFTAPIAIAKGGSYCFNFTNVLKWSNNSDQTFLINYDTSGHVTSFRLEHSGTYTLTVTYGSARGAESTKHDVPGRTRLWTGNITTPPIKVTVRDAR